MALAAINHDTKLVDDHDPLSEEEVSMAKKFFTIKVAKVRKNTTTIQLEPFIALAMVQCIIKIQSLNIQSPSLQKVSQLIYNINIV